MHAYHLSQWLIFFFIYSFIGWIWESCYVSARKRHWVNRGFLHGPMLPIYGSGAIVILVSTIGVREYPWLIFFFGLIAATALEYVTGAVMERMFHVRYWDYSNQKFNLNGYICVSSSLCWGVFSVLLVRVVHVPIERAVLDIPLIAADIAAMVLTVITSVDLTQSFNEAMDFKRVLVQLEESREQIRKLQEKVRAASEEKLEEYRQRSDELVGEYRQRADELVAEYKRRSEQLLEEHKRHTEEQAQKRKSYRKAYQERIRVQREQRRLQLEELVERAGLFMKDDLPDLKKAIGEELRKMGARTDRNYQHIASQLRRNPTASSKKFEDAFRELKDTFENMR
ncbi:MAG TPA: hypothetical protein H9750_05400 [Candidatus Mediterraneibacter excrementavium]|nr:hypothetical protein [Candidatus Mediterraneibacter excrementavium]